MLSLGPHTRLHGAPPVPARRTAHDAFSPSWIRTRGTMGRGWPATACLSSRPFSCAGAGGVQTCIPRGAAGAPGAGGVAVHGWRDAGPLRLGCGAVGSSGPEAPRDRSGRDGQLSDESSPEKHPQGAFQHPEGGAGNTACSRPPYPPVQKNGGLGEMSAAVPP